MMPPALESLARKLAASPRWRWLPGMLTDNGRVVEVRMGPIRVYGVDGALKRTYTGVGSLVGYRTEIKLKSGRPGWPEAWECSPELRIPDLSDPLTAAGLVALAREVAGPTLYTYPTGNGWNAIRSGEVLAWGETEIEALAAVILGGGE